MAFDAIDLVEVIPQPAVRDQVRAADETWAKGDLVNGMGTLRIAFDELFDQHLSGKNYRGSPLAFGRGVRADPFLGGKVAKALTLDKAGGYAPVPSRLAENVGKHVEQLTDAVVKMQRALRIMAIGLDYHRLYRFEMLTPEVSHLADGRREVFCPGPYNPTQEDYDYCRQFVLSAAIRLAELESHLARPGWRE